MICMVVLVFAASSCAVKYQQPNIDTDALYRENAVSDTAFNIAEHNWRDFYKDTILCNLIDCALENNFDLQVALKRVEQSAAYFKQSKWGYAPVIAADASASYGKQTLGKDESEYYSIGLSASWEIDIWGRLTKAKRSKFEQMLAQESTRNAIVTQVVAQVAKAYFSLISLDKQREFVVETIKNRETYLETVKSLKTAGMVNEVAVLQAEAQLVSAKGYIPSIDRTIRETENGLCILLGKPSSTINRSKVNNLIDIEFGNVATGIPVKLLQNRPDILAAEHSLKASLHSYNSAVAAQYPSLTLSGNISSDAAQFNNWLEMPSSILWGVAGGLLQPIFNGRALKTQKQVALKEYEIAEIGFRKSVVNAGMEVSNALYAVKSDKELNALHFKQFSIQNKAYEYSLELLVNGYASYLDVLTAQEGVFNAQIALINSSYDLINDHIELYRALGGGW